MLSKIKFIDVFNSIKGQIERNTGKTCYDYIPKDVKPPFYSLEFLPKRSENNKTMWVEVWTIWVHCYAESDESRLGIFTLIEALEEAMTEELSLPDEAILLSQDDGGVIRLDKEKDEFHAVLEFSFKISYGYKAKIL